MDTKSIIEGIKKIAENYGLTISDDEIEYAEFSDTWYITPYEGECGISCRGGLWYGENINSYTIRFIREDDWKMFDEIAQFLA